MFLLLDQEQLIPLLLDLFRRVGQKPTVSDRPGVFEEDILLMFWNPLLDDDVFGVSLEGYLSADAHRQ